jgi:hypothetical protein
MADAAGRWFMDIEKAPLSAVSEMHWATADFAPGWN